MMWLISKKSIWQSDEMDDVFGVLDVLAKNVIQQQ